MIIKNIFAGVFDEEVHSDFLKFSRGEFKDRYLTEGKKQKDKYSIKTSAEFANYLVRKCLEKANGDVEFKGIIVATFDLRKEAEFEIKKVGNFQGIRKHEIDSKISKDKILKLMEKYPRCFFALSFKTGFSELKIKAKAPKTGKAGKTDEDGPKADFCSLKTSDMALVKELFFDSPDFSEIKAKHILKINEIIYPKDMNGMRPEQVRENSKRKGVLIREVSIDGVKKISEAEFVA